MTQPAGQRSNESSVGQSRRVTRRPWSHRFAKLRSIPSGSHHHLTSRHLVRVQPSWARSSVRRSQCPAPFSTNSGSLEKLKCATRCGCNPKARRNRTMAICDKPSLLRHQPRLQSVLFTAWGLRSVPVLVTASSTRASESKAESVAAARRAILPARLAGSVPAIYKQ